jgi:hypothetical protein
MTTHINILFQALQQIQHQRLAITLLDSTQLDIIFTAARNSACALQVDLIPTKPQGLFQLDASYIRQKNELLVILHFPCSFASDTLTLYEYVPFPNPLHRDPTLPPSTPKILCLSKTLPTQITFPPLWQFISNSTPN